MEQDAAHGCSESILKAVGCNFPSVFGMTLSGPVGIEAPASHHAAGGMINNKH